MANRNEPQVVYCDRGHIYDKSLSIDCPYCNKNRKKKELFPGLSSLFSRKDSYSGIADEDITERVEEDDITEVASDATEVLDDATEVADDATEFADDATEMVDDSTEIADEIQNELPMTPSFSVYPEKKGFGISSNVSVPVGSMLQNSEKVNQSFGGFSWGSNYEFEIDIPRVHDADSGKGGLPDKTEDESDIIPETLEKKEEVSNFIEGNEEIQETSEDETKPTDIREETFCLNEENVIKEDLAVPEETEPIQEQEPIPEVQENSRIAKNEPEISDVKSSLPCDTLERSVCTRSGYVIGWFVVTMGLERGRSFEICEGNNYISFDENGHIFVTDSKDSLGTSCAVITYQESEKEFCIETIDENELYINDGYLKESDILECGDVLSFEQAEGQFYPLLGVEGFDWRQI